MEALVSAGKRLVFDIGREMFIKTAVRRLMGPPPWAFIGRRGLREVVLWLVSDKAMNGAEIIRAVEDVTWGFWRPSPGSVYPLLKQLEAEGLVRRRSDGRYELTESGRGAVKLIPWLRGPRLGAPRSVGEIVEEIESWAMYLSDLAVSDPEKVSPYKERVRQIAELLKKVSEV
ncbi:transcriptional regulator, PadR-like family [Pyrobaculum ferrireducens]|uniref:Transcriptional regulator, PadR-like family n=2 Tax=Pyrobaculum ferrireducens TaxID=1104324 RepID=G7VB50_9CREN|nr:PadR family transcriptional regulator [Pyrobaculum ferrireducens]AET32360.1 transcriptional regulator, PadR-like family [Pyrobaculum ferrireducens]